jgi:hypothetical protein
LKSSAGSAPTGAKTYIQLGRFGDVINILPFLWADSIRGIRHSLMVASEFSSVLDGVSYVDPIIFPGHYSDIGGAVEYAQQFGRPWLCTQINGMTELVREYTYGPAGLNTAVTTSYQKESWRVANRLGEWDKCYPLVFDRRDKLRESALFSQYIPKRRLTKANPKIVLLNTGGTSSPFSQEFLLHEIIYLKFRSKFIILDLSRVHAERIYDLLGLYDRAHCLVSTDTATLHLARACPRLPVYAIVNDQPILWRGSAWMPNYVFYSRYHDFADRMEEFLATLKAMPSPVIIEAPAIVHVWNDYDGKGYLRTHPESWLPTPIQLGACGRDSHQNLKDEKRIPFLRDCLRMGLQRARDVDFVCLTRPDTQFMRPSITEELLRFDACYAYRLSLQDDQYTHVPVVDLFCARKSWWQKHLEEIPDLVFGTDYFWSHALFAIFSKAGAQCLMRSVYRVHNETAKAGA